ncbi:hypothetical protein ATK23_2432 [Glutamicibacter mysorens]|uniref:Uncharacterized protein n=1 Tax=Glutamicibacter mysorens TaxID=257984 RepID=A0ABX4N019_9MICC|nr:hypothetical protein [Glutamicibacter mysorens]PJJ45176.1 hypothetical protein ATK23_2432 [Glutamicibacter mysorens]
MDIYDTHLGFVADPWGGLQMAPATQAGQQPKEVKILESEIEDR